MGHGRNHYYNGVTAGRTTRCCSALALISCCVAAIAAAPKPDRTPLLLFPTRPLWTLALNNQLTVPPAYDATRVFFSIDGDRIVCYEVLSGTQQWLVTARPQMEPVTGDGLLFLVEPKALTALHVEDGSMAWQLPFTEQLVVRPVWDNGWLVLSTSAGSVLALRATDGQPIWSRDLGSPAHGLPALAADRVYASTQNGRVIALNVADGAQVWERRLGGAPNEILALDERLYVGAQDNFFYCLMTSDGRVDWRWRTGGDVIGVPAFDEANVYVVALDNVLRALNRKSGGQRWLRALPFRPAWAPEKVGGTIVVAGQATSLRAYNIADGQSAGEVPASAEIAAAVHVVENPSTTLPTLLIVTRDIAKGAAGVLVTRSIEPETSQITALPNPPIPLPTLPPIS
jgi:outer membrane protein assembly factor BamB